MRVEEVNKLNEASSHYDSKGNEVQPCQCFVPEWAHTLWSIFGDQCQVGGDESPIFIAHIIGVSQGVFVCLCHTPILSTLPFIVHNTL